MLPVTHLRDIQICAYAEERLGFYCAGGSGCVHLQPRQPQISSLGTRVRGGVRGKCSWKLRGEWGHGGGS